MPNASRAETGRDNGLHLCSGPRLELPPAQASDVYGGLRAVRTLAMLSIVGFHVIWEPVFGIAFGLTSLQVIMCALAGRSRSVPPLVPFARKRARRLFLPWLIWSAVYGVFKLVHSLYAGRPPSARFETWMWTSGASFHLWFLPFAFAASLTVNGILRLFRRPRPGIHVAVCALAGTGLLLATDTIKIQLQPSMPWDLWIDGLPSIPFGLAMGRALTIAARPRRAVLLFGIALAALLPHVLAAGPLATSQLYERYAVAIPVVCLGLLVDWPDLPWMAALASMNLGVYLVHMLAIRAMEHMPGFADLGTVSRIALVYVACLLAVVCMRRARIPHLT